MQRLKETKKQVQILLRSLPSWVLALFITSTMIMNLLANKSIKLPVEWLALDCGIIVSWVSFFTMDLIVKRFGAKASIIVTVLSMIVNVFVLCVFAVGASITGEWSEAVGRTSYYAINEALDNTFSGTWFVIFGSSVAYVISGIVNSLSNEFIGKRIKSGTIKGYYIRSCSSTMLGQFVDNFVFSLIVSYNFFGWSMLQCLTCAMTGAIIEMFTEFVFTPIGYRIAKVWDKKGVGIEYVQSYYHG